MRGGVFVCHASQDAGAAQRAVAALEAGGVPCWIAPRDIDPGENYTQAILDALEAAPAIVLVFSSATNESPHVSRELEIAVGSGRRIVPVRLEAVEPSGALRYFIGTSQWLDATGPTDDWSPALVRAVRRAAGHVEHESVLEATPEKASPPAATVPAPATVASRSRGVWVGAISLVAVVSVVVVLVATHWGGNPSAADPAHVASDGTPPSSDSPASGPASESTQAFTSTEGVTCWNGTSAPLRKNCGVPTGRAGLASVFPSLTGKCRETTSAVAGTLEVFECDRDGYLIRYLRWEAGYPKFDYYDADSAVPGHEWHIHGEMAGRMWTVQEEGADERDPYRWSAGYRDYPFSLRVESQTPYGRQLGINEVQATAPSRVGLGA